MRQIIWTLNDDQRTLADLLAYMGNYVRTYLSDQELSFELITPEHIPEVSLSAQARRNLLLVVKEALHNVVKHAKASHVTLVFSCSEALSISIIDNGIGLQRNADLGVGNGLRNMARRMEVLGGSFRVEGSDDKNVESHGTQLRILLPLPPNKGSIGQVVVSSPTSSR
jgi:signal transduction histidine kinase